MPIGNRKSLKKSAGIKLGWAFFGLLVALLFGYGLTRGIFVGSMTEYQASMGGFYTYNCRYLYPDGVRLRFRGVGKSPEEAMISSSGICPLLEH
jgi:hypothetical protein